MILSKMYFCCIPKLRAVIENKVDYGNGARMQTGISNESGLQS